MKKYNKFLILLLVLLGIALAFFYFKPNSTKNGSSDTETTQNLKTTLTAGEKSFDVSAFIGKSALEATQNFTKVEQSGTGENAFVTSIEGRVADSKIHEFWELVINGAPAQVGAGAYIIQNGDSILWRITTY